MDRREMLFGTAALGLAARVDLSSFLNPQHIENGGELMPDKFRVSDRERAQLRGLVKTVVEGEWRKEYDLQGNLLSWRYKNPDGSDYGDSYTYDASGRLLMMVSRVSDGTTIQKVHQYDDKGRLLTITSSDGEHTTFEYDTAGHKTETRVIKKMSERQGLTAIGMDVAFAILTEVCYKVITLAAMRTASRRHTTSGINQRKRRLTMRMGAFWVD